MPVFIGYAAAAIANAFFYGSITAAYIAEAVITIVAVVAGNVALSKITQALAGKAATAGQPPSREVTSRGTIEFRQLIYGEVKTGGFLAFFGASTSPNGTPNGSLWFVIVLAGHEIDDFTDVWLDSRHILKSEIGGGGFVTNPAFLGSDGGARLSIGWSLGTAGSSVSAGLEAAFPEWDSSHIGYGIPYLVFSLGHDDVVWPTGAPSSFYALVKGRKLYDPRLDSTNGGSGTQRFTDPSTWIWTQNWALAVRDYLSGGAAVYGSGVPADKRLTLGEDDARIDDAFIIAAANSSDETVTVPLPILAGTTNWTNGSAAVTGNGTLFTDSLAPGYYLVAPNGARVQVLTVTDDADIVLTAVYGGTTVINEVTHWSATNTSSTTELRFTADCQLSCGNTHSENLQILLSGGNGHISYVGGKYRIFAGTYTAPTVTLTQDDILGPIDVLTHDPMDQVWNYVDGTFFDENNGWTQGNFPAQENSTYETDDGRQYPRSIDLQATRGNYRAQRLAQVILQQGRNMLTINASAVSPTAMQIGEWDTFELTIPEYGWTAQIFRCVAWSFLSSGLISISARSEGPASYADLVLGAYVDPATNNPPAFVTSPPDPPLGFTAVGVMNGVQLTIQAPLYFPSTQFFEIWEYTSNAPFSSATKVGQTGASSFTVPHSDTITRFYWVTVADVNGGRSTNFPSGAGQAAAPLASQFWSPVLRGTAASVGGTIFKNGGAGSWDSDVTSAIPYTGVSIEGTYTGVGASGFGLATAVGSVLQPNASAGFYGIYPHADSGQTVIFAGSTVLATLAAPVIGDRYRVSYQGFYVEIYINNGLQAVFALQGARLYVGIPMFHPGETFTNVQVSTSNIATPSEWRETGACVVSDTSALKQGGASAWRSDGIVSLQGHTACHIAAKINSDLNNNVFFGLTSRPGSFLDAAFNQYVEIDAGWNASTPAAGGNAWVIEESGAVQATFGVPSPSDVAWITYDGTNVRYYLNDPSAPVHTTNAPGLTLYGAATFYDPGAGLNSIDFGPTTTRGIADTPQLGVNAATVAAVSTVAGPVNLFLEGALPLTPQTIASVTVGPYADPSTTIVLTASAAWSYAVDASGDPVPGFGLGMATSGSSTYDIYPRIDGSPGTVGAPPSQTLGSVTTIETVVSLAAGVTKTYVFAGDQGFDGGLIPPTYTHVQISNITFKAEVLKR